MKLHKIKDFDKQTMKQSLLGKIFSVEFIKKDGTPRKMTCRLVSNDKFFKGGELLGDRSHLLEVIDIDLLRRNKGKDPTRCWRSFQLNNITSLKAMGVEWVK